jgi:ABC-2 type transport system ATP-binding protein
VTVSTIEVQDLARVYRTKRGVVEAVRGVDFAVQQGEIVGLLGPNGAGKTTTMRMLATLLKPTSGSAMVAGCDLRSDPKGVRRRIGYVGQSNALSPLSSAREELVLQGRLCQLSQETAERRAEELIQAFSVEAVAARPTFSLSGGQRRRLDIALGLMHGPGLLLLDEPSAGLDPNGRSQLWEHITDLRQRTSTTVLLSTHYLDEADALCDRVLIMSGGKIVAEDSPRRLKEMLGRDRLEIEVRGGADRAKSLLAADSRLQEVTVSDQTIHVMAEHGTRTLIELLRVLEDNGLEPVSARVLEPSLDDVFLAYTTA